MRSKKSVSAAALTIALVLACTGCTSAPENPSTSNAPSGSTASSSASSSASDSASSSSSSESSSSSSASSEEQDQSLFEPVDQSKLVTPYNKEYGFLIIADDKGKIKGPYTYYKNGESLKPFNQRFPVESFPENYLKGTDGYISNYVWDWSTHQILHVKNAKDNVPVDSSKWTYMEGYKYIVEMGNGNIILPFDTYSYLDSDFPYYGSSNRDLCSGWCKEESVETAIAENKTRDIFVLDGCPFPKKENNGSVNIYYYYLYNGNIYYVP